MVGGYSGPRPWGVNGEEAIVSDDAADRILLPAVRAVLVKVRRVSVAVLEGGEAGFFSGRQVPGTCPSGFYAAMIPQVIFFFRSIKDSFLR
jgi:hypothetical protein